MTQDFYNLVKEMRKAQKTYFKYRFSENLKAAKELEARVDKEIERIENILHPKPVQGTLTL